MGRSSVVALTADQLRGRVRVLIDGEEVFLRFDQGALARLIDALGIAGVGHIPTAIASLDGKTLAVLVWAGRLWEIPELTMDEVSKYYFPLLPTYTAALEAINLSLWGTTEPDLGGSEDDADPTGTTVGRGESGTSKTLEPLQ